MLMKLPHHGPTVYWLEDEFMPRLVDLPVTFDWEWPRYPVA